MNAQFSFFLCVLKKINSWLLSFCVLFECVTVFGTYINVFSWIKSYSKMLLK